MSEKGNWALKGQERSVMCFSFAVFSGGGKTGSLRVVGEDLEQQFGDFKC